MVVYKHICCKPYLPYYDFHTVTHIFLKHIFQHNTEIHKIKKHYNKFISLKHLLIQ